MFAGCALKIYCFNMWCKEREHNIILLQKADTESKSLLIRERKFMNGPKFDFS